MKHESLLERLMEQPLAEAREKARQEGIQKGIQEGRELGARETAIHSLMAVLDARFQDCDVQILKPAFEAITDLQLLNQLLRTAAQAPTIDEVVRTLVQPRNNGPNADSPETQPDHGVRTRRSANHAGSDEPAQQ